MSLSYVQLKASLTTSVSIEGKKCSLFTENLDHMSNFLIFLVALADFHSILDVRKLISEEDISVTTKKERYPPIKVQFVLRKIKDYR